MCCIIEEYARSLLKTTFEIKETSKYTQDDIYIWKGWYFPLWKLKLFFSSWLLWFFFFYFTNVVYFLFYCLEMYGYWNWIWLNRKQRLSLNEHGNLTLTFEVSFNFIYSIFYVYSLLYVFAFISVNKWNK